MPQWSLYTIELNTTVHKCYSVVLPSWWPQGEVSLCSAELVVGQNMQEACSAQAGLSAERAALSAFILLRSVAERL